MGETDQLSTPLPPPPPPLRFSLVSWLALITITAKTPFESASGERDTIKQVRKAEQAASRLAVRCLSTTTQACGHQLGDRAVPPPPLPPLFDSSGDSIHGGLTSLAAIERGLEQQHPAVGKHTRTQGCLGLVAGKAIKIALVGELVARGGGGDWNGCDGR
jgi:hypothetical protein